MLPLKEKFRLLGFAIGIFFSYTLMGVAIEKIFKSDFDGEKFDFSIAFVSVQCIVYTFVSKAATMTYDHPKNETGQKYYICVAVFYFLGMITANIALQYISYPMQVIGKACKPIPIMIFGVLIVKKSYTTQKYLFVLMIIAGIIAFMYKRDNTSENELAYLGNILIALSLLADGLMGAAQDLMRKVAKPTALNFMCYVNLYSALLSTMVISISGEGIRFIDFCMNHQAVLVYLGIVVFTGSFGQYFTSSMISNFGSLPLSLVTTLRKFVTVLFSVCIFNNTLTLIQWIATAVIFNALLLDVIFGSKQAKKEPEDQKTSKSSEAAINEAYVAGECEKTRV